MTLMEKFASLTPEQREKFDEVNDEATLVAFAVENNIELTDEDKKKALTYVENGVVPMSDNDLEAVAGGANKDNSPNRAAEDGRLIPLPVMTGLCRCHHKNKWARSKETLKGELGLTNYRFIDIKCYKCYNTWAEVYTIW